MIEGRSNQVLKRDQIHSSRSAEREGFEPSIAVTHYAGLANLCLQPLGHLSELKNDILIT
jgi:hypothetical protein